MKTIPTSTPISTIKGLFPAAQGERAFAKGIPMEMLNLVRAFFKAEGVNIRVAYRGPRAQSVGRIMKGYNGYSNYKRSRFSAQSSCLKSDATSFAVYLK
jgi:hypothetical protein